MKFKVIYMLTTVFYPSIGGRESHIHNISKELVKMGYVAKIIFPVIDCKEPCIYNLDGIEVHCIKIGNEHSKKQYEEYKRKSNGTLGYLYGYLRKYYYNHFYKEIISYIEADIKDNRYNPSEVLMHEHDFISGYKLSKVLAKKYPVIFTNHTGEFLFLKKLPFSSIPIKYLTEHFKYAISPSEELNAFKGIRPEGTYGYIPNGVDINEFCPATVEEIDKLREVYKIPTDKVILLCPRRWAPTKGIIYLIEAINKLKASRVSEKFVVAFAGNDYEDYPEYRTSINTFIKEHELESHILLLGNLPYEKMKEITKASDVIVIPSLMEAVSLSMLESMACGKIVIGSDTGGIPEVIKHGKTGFLVEKANSEALAAQLEDVIIKINDLDDIRHNAVQLVSQAYTWQAITKRVEEVYRSIK